MNDRFASYHPVVNFIYFALVIGFSMALQHPIAQLISLLCACVYAIQAEGRKAVLFCLKWCLPIMLLTVIMNPVFSHEGVTILAYLPTGNPLTLESILYGASSGVMIATVMLWFVNFNRVITSEKLIYLFGRIVPALSLMLSMALRLIPKFRAQMRDVVEAQRCIGRDISQGFLWRRIKLAITVLSVTVTWALENAIETADSMKSRGYGLKGRTAFSIYCFDERDKMALLYLGFSGFCLICGVIVGAFTFHYFPSVRCADFNTAALAFQFLYLILCIMPAAVNRVEENKWKVIRSSM